MKVCEIFNPLLEVVSSENFLNLRLTQNEPPHFICPFEPTEQDGMDDAVDKLVRKLASRGVTAYVIDVYDVMIARQEANGDLEWNLEHETDGDHAEFRSELAGQVDANSEVIPEIARRVAANPAQVYFITGIGACYPLLSPAKVYNGFKEIFRDRPVVAFFPGEYSVIPGVGSMLHLFGNEEGERFYRAFDVRNFFSKN